MTALMYRYTEALFESLLEDSFIAKYYTEEELWEAATKIAKSALTPNSLAQEWVNEVVAFEGTPCFCAEEDEVLDAQIVQEDTPHAKEVPFLQVGEEPPIPLDAELLSHRLQDLT